MILNTRTEYKRSLSKKWIAEGKCPNCGSRPPAPSRRTCEKCLDTSLRATRRARGKNPDSFRNHYQARKKAGLCVVCGVSENPRTNGLCCTGCSKTERQRTVRIKFEVMQRYGGECFCCGENRIAFLTLDHLNNDGGTKRASKEHSGGGHFYKRLRAAPIDSTLRVACFNCNCGRRSTGICPHQDNSYFEEALARGRWDRRSSLKAQGEQLWFPGFRK